MIARQDIIAFLCHFLLRVNRETCVIILYFIPLGTVSKTPDGQNQKEFSMIDTLKILKINKRTRCQTCGAVIHVDNNTVV